jgi:hypothetical protein
MSHQHNHQGCCDHENIKLCKKCGVPYCLDCGKEWSEKTQYVYSPYYPYTITYNPYYDNTWWNVSSDNSSDTTAYSTCSCKHES